MNTLCQERYDQEEEEDTYLQNLDSFICIAPYWIKHPGWGGDSK